MKLIRGRLLPIAVVLTLLMAILCAGCSGGSSNDQPDANLVFTASNPANGDATLDAPTVVYDPNADGTGFDRLTVSQTVGTIDHTFYFYFTPTTGAPHSAQHVWGPAAGGIAQCVAPDCVAANAVVDTSAHVVTFTNLVMSDPIGSGVSTVSGTITY